MYRSPKYWKEMARARKEHEAKVRFAKDQASSDKQQAPSSKHQASSTKQQAQFRMILRIILKDII